ncbi:hypothetical protein [Pontixanthobacter sp.]|uniref:hypothetical protein n=1 Tax=Pontixanthobacter sp. TaxID=2792078 RepID=UPI003C7C4F8C
MSVGFDGTVRFRRGALLLVYVISILTCAVFLFAAFIPDLLHTLGNSPARGAGLLLLLDSFTYGSVNIAVLMIVMVCVYKVVQSFRKLRDPVAVYATKDHFGFHATLRHHDVFFTEILDITHQSGALK